MTAAGAWLQLLFGLRLFCLPKKATQPETKQTDCLLH
jgi:hypothetical protein